MNSHIQSSELVIRPASFNDIQYIRDIAYKTWPSTYAPILPAGQVTYMLDRIYSTQSLADQIRNNHLFFLALLNDDPVGFASFSHETGVSYKLQKLYVLPTIQKTGAGRKMLETIETIIKSMNGEVLLLNVNRNNVAKTFYEKNGFAIIKEEDIDIGNGYFMNDYIMQKEL